MNTRNRRNDNPYSREWGYQEPTTVESTSTNAGRIIIAIMTLLLAAVLLTMSIFIFKVDFHLSEIDTQITQLENSVDSLKNGVEKTDNRLNTLESTILKLNEYEATMMWGAYVIPLSLATPHSDFNDLAWYNAKRLPWEDGQPPQAKSKRYINVSNIAQKSNLTAAEFNAIIELQMSSVGKSGSKFRGVGEILVEMENEYEVNGLFCLAVGCLESSYGTSYSANNRNNLFGIMRSGGVQRTFSSVAECIDYWGNMIRSGYMNRGLTTISSIQPVYCPGSTTWTDSVSGMMHKYISKVETLDGIKTA